MSKFATEWNRFRDIGRIQEDYENTEQHYTCFQEMLDFLDNDSRDETRFEVLKKIFLVAATENVTDRESFLPQQYMKVCRSMSAGELIVMSTVYKIAQRKFKPISAADQWLEAVAKESGLIHPELVEMHEDQLIRKHLLMPRIHTDQNDVALGPYFRLTNLAYNICRYVDNYEKIKKEADHGRKSKAKSQRQG